MSPLKNKISLSKMEEETFNLFIKEFSELSQHDREYFMSDLMPAMVRKNINHYSESILNNNFEPLFKDGRTAVQTMNKVNHFQSELSEKMGKNDLEKFLDKKIKLIEDLIKELESLLEKIVIEKAKQTAEAAKKGLKGENHSKEDARIDELEKLEERLEKALASLKKLLDKAQDARDRVGCIKGTAKEIIDFWKKHKDEIEAIQELLKTLKRLVL